MFVAALLVLVFAIALSPTAVGQDNHQSAPSQKQTIRGGVADTDIGTTQASSRNKRAELCTVRSDLVDKFVEKFGNVDGWTRQAVQEVYIWSDETKVSHALKDREEQTPISQAWRSRYIAADKIINDYVKKLWPDDVLCYMRYHVTFDRTGKITQYCREHGPTLALCPDQAKCEKLAAQGLAILSNSRAYAFPPKSKAQKYHCTIIFENYDDPAAKN
jgi:hypothetical protein